MFARKTEVHFEPLNLNDVVHEVLHLVRETFPKTIEVSLTLDTEIPLIEGDATQLHQVLLNLCVNARDAMPKGGVLRIATYRSTGSLIKEHSPKAHENEYVTLEVADNGCGMDEETMRRIFEPFFTTKEKGKGTGLGLSLVYGIIESHGGIITVESKVGQGSTFRCYFPTVLGRTQSVPRFTSPDTLRGGTETILIVEDELLLRSLLHDLLTNYGYRVHLAADGEEALDIYNRYTSIDLVISDYGLPKFTGEELYRRLKQRNQDIRFILASGFIEPLLKEQM
ncbi:MAG: ATP-binding protein [Bacteroidetes bacterium]|nr:ATP-binding protein [Bacteroidota bacterium]